MAIGITSHIRVVPHRFAKPSFDTGLRILSFFMAHAGSGSTTNTPQ